MSAQNKSNGPVIRSNSSSTKFYSAHSSSFQRPTSLSDRPGSPIIYSRRFEKSPAAKKRSCMCAPTNHPGSFRCSLHKGGFGSNRASKQTASSGLNMIRRSAIKNSLQLRIGTVEGDLVKRALIRPSSHNQRRRGEFRPRPTRLSSMSKA